jgi:hypothetical protein
VTTAGRKGHPGRALRRIAASIRPNLCGVYVIQCEESGRYKIGKSLDVAVRLKQHSIALSSDRMPGTLRLRRIIPCTERRLGHLELLLHWLYDPHRTSAEEVFEAGLIPPPESLRTVADVFAACRAVEDGE